LGSFAADKRGSQPGAPELSESLDASVALRVLVWDLEVSEVGAVRGSAAWEKGEVSSGDAEVTGPMLQVTGIAELPEGPARLKLSATWAHGVAMLRRKADSLQGTVRLSVDGGKDKSDLKIYEGTVRLLPTK
jgi:hypothetical protein